LRDPSANLAGMVARAAAMPALAIAALLAHRAWPSIAASARFSLPAGLASGYAIIGTTLAMALPDITREAITGTGAAWIVLPVIACIGLFVWPAFQTRATTSMARVEAQKTEADLSSIVAPPAASITRLIPRTPVTRWHRSSACRISRPLR
jgi:phosphate/sulfate permease